MICAFFYMYVTLFKKFVRRSTSRMIEWGPLKIHFFIKATWRLEKISRATFSELWKLTKGWSSLKSSFFKKNGQISARPVSFVAFYIPLFLSLAPRFHTTLKTGSSQLRLPWKQAAQLPLGQNKLGGPPKPHFQGLLSMCPAWQLCKLHFQDLIWLDSELTLQEQPNL